MLAKGREKERERKEEREKERIQEYKVTCITLTMNAISPRELEELYEDISHHERGRRTSLPSQRWRHLEVLNKESEMGAYSFAFILRREMRHKPLGKLGSSSYQSFKVLCKFEQKTFFTEMKTEGHKGKKKQWNIKLKAQCVF